MRIIVLTLFFVLLFSSDIFPQSRTRPGSIGRLLSTSSALNPDGPAAPDSIVAIRGMRFSEETADSCCAVAYELGGVRAWIGEEPQMIVAVSPDEIRIVPSAFTAWIIVRASDGRIGYAVLRMATASPTIVITGEPESAEFQARRPLAIYFDNQFSPQPVGIDPVPLPAPGSERVVILFGSGFRNAAELAVIVGGVRLPALSVIPFGFVLGYDEVFFSIPADFAPRGELDVLIEADGRVSNAARVRIE